MVEDSDRLRDLLAVRDAVAGLLDYAGAFDFVRLMKQPRLPSAPTVMACLHQLIDLGELTELHQPDVPGDFPRVREEGPMKRVRVTLKRPIVQDEMVRDIAKAVSVRAIDAIDETHLEAGRYQVYRGYTVDRDGVIARELGYPKESFDAIVLKERERGAVGDWLDVVRDWYFAEDNRRMIQVEIPKGNIDSVAEID